MKKEPWQAVGDELMQGWRAGRANAINLSDPAKLAELNEQLVAAGGRPIRPGPTDLDNVLMAYLGDGSPTKIVEYLRTRKLSWSGQEKLAWALEERARPKKWRRDGLWQIDRRMRADSALSFYGLWLAENKKRGVKDGHCRTKMKHQCCEFVVHSLGGTPLCTDVDAIEALLRQPESRRR